MISPISFSSVYKASYIEKSKKSPNTPEAMRGFRRVGINYEDRDECYFITKESRAKKDNRYHLKGTIIAPDELDEELEFDLASYGVNYDKLTFYELLKPKNIKSRIAKAPEGMVLALIDASRMDELIYTQDSNLNRCKTEYLDNKEETDNMIKCGDKFPASTLKIGSSYGTNELLDLIRKHGASSLYKNAYNVLYFEFDQKTDKPDHCVYSALRGMGMNKIPVYVDKNSYKIAQKIGLTK